MPSGTKTLTSCNQMKSFWFTAILTTPSEDITELNKAIISCQNLVNREWELRQSNSKYDTIQINVGKVTVPAENLFDQG